MSESFTVRSLARADELTWVIDLQATLINRNDPHALSLHTLIDIARNGGHIIGVFERRTLVGFVVSFLGTDSRDPHRPAMANLKLSITRMAVHLDYRNIGLGTRMLLRLRDIAIKQGIRLVTYALDPLNSREANLMIRKMGAMAKRFIPDYYRHPSDEGQLLSSDRLLAEWWITHNRVEERLFGKRSHLMLDHYLEAMTPIINPSAPTTTLTQLPEKSLLLLEVSSDLDQTNHPAWQKHIRDMLLLTTQAGYVATDFLYEPYEGRHRAFYLLSYDGPRLTLGI